LIICHRELEIYNADKMMGSRSLPMLIAIKIEMGMEIKTRMSLWRKRGDPLGLETCSISIFIDVYTTINTGAHVFISNYK
jgi:hypothetical protein